MGVSGKKVVILLEKDYQDLEVWYPALRLREAGVHVIFVAPVVQDYKGKYGYPARADLAMNQVEAATVDAVVIPGGWAPDFLRRHEPILRLVRDLHAAGKPVAAICHAGWVLASAGILKGKTATSFSAIRDDVQNAGAHWVDQEVVVDGSLITSRTPEDLPAFCRELLAQLAKTPSSQ